MRHRTDYAMSRLRRVAARLTLIVGGLWLSACAAQPESVAQMPSPSPQPTTPAPTEPVPTLAPTIVPTPEGPFGVVVWWPEPLAPLDNETAAEVLSEQLTAFQRDNDDITVEFRLKKVEDTGGIMSTLRAASAVAPGAIPDLTLLRREDLLIAAQAGLIQPLNRLSPAVLEDVQDVGLELGRSGDALYGVAYTLEVQHLAYPADVSDGSDWTFAAVLEKRVPFLFPAGRTAGISDVLLVQYIANGGTRAPSGEQAVNRDALMDTLEFYEAAMEEGIITPTVLEYAAPSDYAAFLADGDPVAAVVTSTLYRELVSSGVELSVGPIPTRGGAPVTLADGWMWVLTTADAERQTRALRFLNWMMDAERQARYTNEVHMLPSQRTAMRQMDDPEYGAFVAELLTNAILPLTESESGSAARALQNALAAVLSGQQTASEAARDVLSQFGD